MRGTSASSRYQARHRHPARSDQARPRRPGTRRSRCPPQPDPHRPACRPRAGRPRPGRFSGDPAELSRSTGSAPARQERRRCGPDAIAKAARPAGRPGRHVKRARRSAGGVHRRGPRRARRGRASEPRHSNALARGGISHRDRRQRRSAVRAHRASRRQPPPGASHRCDLRHRQHRYRRGPDDQGRAARAEFSRPGAADAAGHLPSPGELG